MDSTSLYTLEEAKVILHAEEIKRRNRQKRKFFELIKRKTYGLALIIMAIVEPYIVGPDPVTGLPDATFSIIVTIAGIYFIFFHNDRKEK